MYELGGPLDGVTVDPGTNLLLSGPPMSGKTDVGFEVLREGASRGEGAIVVTNQDGADRVHADHPDLFEHDAPVGIVDCVSRNQSGGSVSEGDLVQYASSPEDMTGIGIRFSELLEDFYGERGVTRNRVLFVSVSTLLLYSNLQTVFRFLHVFTSRIQNADALGLFVVQSDAHEDQEMNTISQLFDGYVRTDADGEIETRLP